MKRHVKDILTYLKNTGSTWAPLNELRSFDVRKAIRDKEVYYRSIKGRGFVTVPYFYEQEKRVARKVMLRVKPIEVDEDRVSALIEKFEQMESERMGFNFRFADEQKEGIHTFLKSWFAILTGGPGTGKTSVLKGAAQIIKWTHERISVTFTAPTGKAARRITESSGYPATTLQKYIGDGGMGNLLKMVYDDYFIIDEVSMLDMDTFEKTLDSLSYNTHLFIVGDVDQLPSVGIGAVLRDLIDSKLVPCCQLEKTFRQDNSSVLFDNIQIVKQGGYLPLREGPDFIRIKTEENVLENCISKYLEAVAEFGLENVVALTPYRKQGIICSEKLNAILQNKLNPFGKTPSLKTTVYRDEGRALQIRFQVGDPVIQLENREKIANGDVGTVIKIINDVVVVKYSDCVIDYKVSDLNQLDLAYALSIHKSQGSEYKYVVIPVLKENTNVDRNSIYTGITRAKKVCCLIGDDEVIMAACKMQSAWQRYTFLSDEIEKYVLKQRLIEQIVSA